MKTIKRLSSGKLCAALFLGLFLSLGAVAGEITGASDSPCANSVVDAEQAKSIASDYLAELGYEEQALQSEWHFSLRDSTCVNGQWRVGVDLGPHASIKKKRMVLVNCQTGEVEEHFAEGEDVAIQ